MKYVLENLVAVGAQDSYVKSEDINDSLFNNGYSKHTTFRMEYNEVELNGAVTIAREGDLLHDFFISFNVEYKISETEALQFLENIKIEIGGQPIIQYTKESLYTSLIIKGSVVSIVPIYDDNGYIKYNVKIPISTFREPLQHIALSYHDVRIYVKQSDKKITPYKSIQAIEGNNTELVECYHILPRELVLEVYKWVLRFQEVYKKPVQLKLGKKSIYLDNPERHHIAKNPHQHLIEGYQDWHQFSTECRTDLTERLNLNHPTKYIAVLISNSKNKLDFNHKIDPLIGIQMIFNGAPSNLYDPNFLRVSNPRTLLGKELPMGMYLISYSLKPQDYDPSSSVNVSRIDCYIRIKFPKNSPNYYVTVVACNYNIMKVQSGMAGLVFSQ
jgi:hypothetical protein